MAGFGKLDHGVLEVVRRAARLGLSEREIYEAAGVAERTWYKWKAKAKAVAAVLPNEWQTLRYEELADVADDLGIDLSPGAQVGPRSGANGRLTRADLIRIIQERADRYAQVLRELEASRPQAKLAILQKLEDLAEGRCKIRKTRTTQRVVYDQNGRPQPTGEAIVTTEEVELPPNPQVLLKTLDRHWPVDHPGGRRGVGGSAVDPDETARIVAAAVHRMTGTVPPPPDEEVPG